MAWSGRSQERPDRQEGRDLRATTLSPSLHPAPRLVAAQSLCHRPNDHEGMHVSRSSRWPGVLPGPRPNAGGQSPSATDRPCERYAVPMPGCHLGGPGPEGCASAQDAVFAGFLPTRPPREPSGATYRRQIDAEPSVGAPPTRAPDRRPQASVEAMRSDLTQVALAVGVRLRATANPRPTQDRVRWARSRTSTFPEVRGARCRKPRGVRSSAVSDRPRSRCPAEDPLERSC
jgi:hypothetical protein